MRAARAGAISNCAPLAQSCTRREAAEMKTRGAGRLHVYVARQTFEMSGFTDAQFVMNYLLLCSNML